MKFPVSSLLFLPLALAGCMIVAPGAPGPGPARPGVVVTRPPGPAPAIIFAPGVQPYVYEVTTINRNVYEVRYLPAYVTRVQILAGFRNRCAALGLQPVAGQIRLIAGHDRRNRPAQFQVMTVYCR